MRFYPDPKGNRYPSVTSVLDAIKPPKDLRTLQAWDEKELAEGRGGVKESRLRGGSVHQMREHWILGEESQIDSSSPYYPLFQPLVPALKLWEKEFHIWCEKPVLKKAYPELVFFDEDEKKERGRLWCEKQGFAGCPDDLGVWDGELMLCDLKTSKKLYYRTKCESINRGLWADEKRGDPIASKIIKEFSLKRGGFRSFQSCCTQLAGYDHLIQQRLEITPSQWMVMVAVLPDESCNRPTPKLQLFRLSQEEMDFHREEWQKALCKFFRKYKELKPASPKIII